MSVHDHDASVNRFSPEVEDGSLLPHNIELEQALLGAVLADNGQLDICRDVLAADDFFVPLHAAIWEEAGKAIAAGGRADPLTLRHRFATVQVDDITGGQYLGRLYAAARTTHARDYAELVADLAARRRLIALGRDLSKIGQDARSTPELLDDVTRRIGTIASGSTPSQAVPVGIALQKAMDRIVKAYKRGEPGGVSTGIKDLDAKIGKLQPGHLIILAGRPAMGKTGLALNVAWDAANRRWIDDDGIESDPRLVLFFSLEMGLPELGMRVIAERSEIGADRLSRGNVSEDEIRSALDTSKRYGGVPLQIDESSGLSIASLSARARRAHAENGPLGLIVIDYLGLLKGTSRRSVENRVHEIAEITAGLKSLAKELQVPVLALAQLNRGVENRTDKRPMLADLRECLPGEALVLNADTGQRVPIRSIVEHGLRFNVWAMDKNLRLVRKPIVEAWEVGRKPLLRLTSATGRTLVCTESHKVLTDHGYVEAGKLDPDKHSLALPRTYGEPQWPKRTMSEDAGLVLGLLLGNGWMGGTPTITMPVGDDPEIFMAPARRAFGVTPSVKAEHLTDKAVKISYSMGFMCGAGKNPMTRWLRTIGVWRKTAKDKHIPGTVFGQESPVIAAVLRGLFQTDGCVTERKGRPIVKMCTISERLASDVVHLLCRLGIVAIRSRSQHKDRMIHGKAVKSTARDMYTVHISAQSIQRFADVVGFMGRKAERLAALLSTPKENDAAAVDRIPLSVNAHVDRLRAEHGMSHASLGWRNQGKRMSRSTAAALAVRVGDPLLQTMANSDVLWDEIRTIERLEGEHDVFDLTVGDLHNFCVDDFVTHNSGSIEQDADLVLFVYRESYYATKSPPDPEDLDAYEAWQAKLRACDGKAEIIVAKNRHGQTATVTTAFNAALMRFSDLAITERTAPANSRRYPDD